MQIGHIDPNIKYENAKHTRSYFIANYLWRPIETLDRYTYTLF